MRIITSENETRLWWLFVFNIRENLVKKYFNPLKPDSARIVYEILPLQYADPDVEPMPKKMEIEKRAQLTKVRYALVPYLSQSFSIPCVPFFVRTYGC